MEERNLTPREKQYWHRLTACIDTIDQLVTEAIDLMLEGDLTKNQREWIGRNYTRSSLYNQGDAREWLEKEVLNEC